MIVLGAGALSAGLWTLAIPLWGLALGLPAVALPVLGLRRDDREEEEYVRLHRKWLTSGYVITSDGVAHDVTEMPRPRAAAE